MWSDININIINIIIKNLIMAKKNGLEEVPESTMEIHFL